MSFNRLSYDRCAYDKRITEGTSVLSWVLDPNKYYNCNPCRVEFGLVGGNNVSNYIGNMVDLESDMRGQTRLASKCPETMFLPGTVIQGKVSNGCSPGCGTTGLPCGSLSCRKDPVKHLPACNIIDYAPRYDNVGYELVYPPCVSTVKTRSKPKKEHRKRFVPSAWQGQMGQGMGAKY